MTNQEKLEALKQWLTENGYRYDEGYKSRTCGVVIDLRVRNPRIAVRIGDDDEFFKRVRSVYAPFFIRESESVEFIIIKIQNCIQTFSGKGKPSQAEEVKESVVEKRKRPRFRKPVYHV